MSPGRVILTVVGLAVFAMTCISIGVGLGLWHEATYDTDIHPGLH